MNTKYAIITGSSSGVGGAIATSLAKTGYFVILIGRNLGKLEDLQTKILSHKGKCKIIKSELNTFEGINKLVEEIKAETKDISVLVNAAAIWHGENEVFADKDFESFPDQVVKDTMMVGLMAPTLLTHSLIPLMSKGSKVINISGTFEDGGKGWLPYFISKRGIEDLTIGLADELKTRDIQVNAISPSDTATPAYSKYFPQFIKDAIQPEEIAQFVLELCSPEMSNITGKVFVIKKDHPVIERFHA